MVSSTAWGVGRSGISTALARTMVVLGMRRGAEPATARSGPRIVLGLLWAVLGWSPLLMPSLGWHAYYALLGCFGAWLALGAGLARRPAVAVTLVVAVRLKYSSYGRSLLSIREDEIAAQAVGINVTRYKVRAFVL